MKYCIMICLLLSGALRLSAQRNVRDSIIGTPWIAVHYGGMWTGGDLKARYGYLNQIGGVIGYKTNRNWIWGIEGNFIFGDKIHVTGLFDNLVDSYGNITDVNGDIAKVLVLARGTNVNATIGKVFPILSPNKNSGILVHFGAGYLMHKMRIDTRDQVIPQIETNYRKGYDRLTTGYNFHQFVGYSFMANRGLVNFYAGFYISEGFTYNRRRVFFDQPGVPVPQNQLFDLQYGFKAGWLVPVYKRKPKDFYYN